MDIGGWLRSLGLERYEAAFREDERSLGILPATFYPRATAHVAADGTIDYDREA